MSHIPPTASSARARASDGHHAHEVARGERFEFGKNSASFLRVLDEARIGSCASSPPT
jgi:hypothetical protein